MPGVDVEIEKTKYTECSLEKYIFSLFLFFFLFILSFKCYYQENTNMLHLLTVTIISPMDLHSKRSPSNHAVAMDAIM
jgi:hypothetical protein